MTARSDEGEIMALRHREHPIVGMQFHPESVLTEHGHALLRGFLGSGPQKTATCGEDLSVRSRLR